MTTRSLLLHILADGPKKLDEVLLALARSGKLGFGVEPADVWSSALLAGVVVGYNDGQKTWARLAAPFVQLERGIDGEEFIAYQATNKFGVSTKRDAISFYEGQLIEVQWPDKSISREVLVCEPDSPRSLPGIMHSARGLSVWIPLDHPGLKVRSDAF